MNQLPNQQQLIGLARHAMTTFGGFMIAQGKVDATTWEMWTGIVVMLAGMVASYFAKEKKA